MKESFVKQIKEYLRARENRKKWYYMLTCLGLAVVIATTYLISLPAVTMEWEEPVLKAGRRYARLGKELELTVSSHSEGGIVYLYTQAENAGISNEYHFRQDVVQVTDGEGREIQLHREYVEDGVMGYWFEAEEPGSLTLSWKNGVAQFVQAPEGEEGPEGGVTEKPGSGGGNGTGSPERPGTGNEGGSLEKPGNGNEDGNTGKPGNGNENEDGNLEKPGSGNEDGNTGKPGNGNENEDGNLEKPGSGNEGGNTGKPGYGNEGGSSEKPGSGSEDGNTGKPGSGNEDGNPEKPGSGNENGNTGKPGSGNEDGNTGKPGSGNEDGNAGKPGSGSEDGNTGKPGSGNEGGSSENPGSGNEGGSSENPGSGNTDNSESGNTEDSGSGSEGGSSEDSGAESGDGDTGSVATAQASILYRPRILVADSLPPAVLLPAATGNQAQKATPSEAEPEEDELHLIQEKGDKREEGFLMISAGIGADLEEAREYAAENTQNSITLSWLTDENLEALGELVFEGIESDTSQAVVYKENEGEDFPQFMPLSLYEEMEDQASSEGYDFTDDITSVDVSRLVNGQWVSGTEFTDGDSVKVEIKYTIPARVVGAQNRVIYYQLPEGMRLHKEESGVVYDKGGNAVGLYTIGTDGMIRITFDEAFSDDKPFEGIVMFQGTVSAGQGGTDQKIEFGGGGGSITIKPGEKETDISLKKTGSFKEDGKLHYEITVSTQAGTPGEITVSDAFGWGNTKASYDQSSFKVIKYKTPSSLGELVTGYKLEFYGLEASQTPSFKLSGLPQLQAGEKYVITYTATPEKAASANGFSEIENWANGTSGNRVSGDGEDIVISEVMIQKDGWYDTANNKIQWRILLNKDGRDLNGYVLWDIMKIDGKDAYLPDKVTMKNDRTGDTVQISLPYKFTYSTTDSYTITYETDPPASGAGETSKIYNKAVLQKGDEQYEDDATVVVTNQNYGVEKKFWDILPEHTTAERGMYTWMSRITVPQEDLDLSRIVYTDYLKEPVLNGKTVEGSHYTTPEVLKETAVYVNNTGLSSWVYEILDLKGTPIEKLDPQTHLKGFQIRFLPPAKNEIKGGPIDICYYSWVDYTKLEGGEEYVIGNSAEIPDHSTGAETPITPPKRLEKQASPTGPQNGNSTSYTSGKIQIDFTENGGVIHYRLLIRTGQSVKGDIVVTDLLPRGASLIEDTVKLRFYDGDYWEYDQSGSYQTQKNISHKILPQNGDGTTPVEFTIKDGYNSDGKFHTLSLYYDADISGDSIWSDDPALENHIYTNHASWDSWEDEVETEVNREVPDVKKTGEQLPQLDADGNPILDNSGQPIMSDRVRYRVLVNAGQKDLVPGADFITLTDVLTVQDGAAGADYLPESVALYHYDPKAEDMCGDRISSERYTYTYDSKTHTLVFQLPDSTACVLVYDYLIDRGTAGGDLNIRNQVKLTGGQGGGSDNQVVLKETSSGAMVSKKVLTIYKVDSTNFGALLPGARFSLEAYKNGSWTGIDGLYETDQSGSLQLSFSDEGYKENTLYRLEETDAPSGYEPSAVSYYFVWMANGKNQEQTMEELRRLGLPESVEEDDILFISSAGAIYVPNEPVELRVKKLWIDEDGRDIEGTGQVKVKLWQQPVKTNAKTVTVVSTGHKDWSTPHTERIQVAESSSLGIRIQGVYIDSLDIQAGNAPAVSVPTGSGQVWSYTVEEISDDTTIQIRPTNKDEGNSFGNISFFDYTEPYQIPAGEKQLYGTITLSEDNNWSYIWRDLPKEDSEGKPYRYTVEELPVPGFSPSYSSNNQSGIQTGELVITNRASGYTLPETGGMGSRRYTEAGLGLIAAAGMIYLFILRRKEGDIV